MPSLYQRSAASQLPLTPPDSGSGYGYSNMHYSRDPFAAHQSMMPPMRHDSGFDYQQPYMQPPVAPAPPTYQYSQSSYQTGNSLPPLQSFYEPMGAPLLPPLRINDHLSFTDDYNRRLQQEQLSATHEQQRQPPKEEKATGGVSAKLDYDMDHMTDFVAEATGKMYAYHNSPVCLADIDVTRSFGYSMQSHPSFRKWVHQVLSATRLPSATILLSLHYLNDRLANHPHSVQTSENQIYRLLAVALILGSKFLDDNTFINRSWSDVTAIKVTELNQLEMEWLGLIHYHLHIDPASQNGLQSWLDGWKQYQAEKVAKQQQQMQAARLSPLDTTNVYRHAGHRSERFSPYPSPYSARSAYETPHTARSSNFGASTYANDPWARNDRPLDDFYKPQHRYPTLSEMDEANRRASEERARAYQTYYQPTSYGSGWDQQWSGVHRYDCNCATCSYQQHYRPYPTAHSYNSQTAVMG
ncbi:cyclin-like protein [Saxophila tyrrhenica]|uniref:Cyclin-like protein n=1 Tax=Saxophila tyrrhenica TaxID=1690608 RepID=A0AAV9PCR3_9PEZI|nr:cyclin-like protein [Saxophila tyrrhenica]